MLGVWVLLMFRHSYQYIHSRDVFTLPYPGPFFKSKFQNDFLASFLGAINVFCDFLPFDPKESS